MKSIGIIVDYIANCIIEARGVSVEGATETEVVEIDTETDAAKGVEKVVEEVIEVSNEEQK